MKLLDGDIQQIIKGIFSEIERMPYFVIYLLSAHLSNVNCEKAQAEQHPRAMEEIPLMAQTSLLERIHIMGRWLLRMFHRRSIPRNCAKVYRESNSLKIWICLFFFMFADSCSSPDTECPERFSKSLISKLL